VEAYASAANAAAVAVNSTGATLYWLDTIEEYECPGAPAPAFCLRDEQRRLPYQLPNECSDRDRNLLADYLSRDDDEHGTPFSTCPETATTRNLRCFYTLTERVEPHVAADRRIRAPRRATAMPL
jgi:hypothetical protein